MVACTRAAIHLTGHQCAGNALILKSASIDCQVAQVLERLGVALADHLLVVGCTSAMEHIDQLPGGIVRMGRCSWFKAISSIIIIGYCVLDVLKICHELVVIALGGVFRDHTLSNGNGIRRRDGFGGVWHIMTSCLYAIYCYIFRFRCGILRTNGHGNSQFYGKIVFAAGAVTYHAVTAFGLIKPIQLIRHGGEQSLYQGRNLRRRKVVIDYFICGSVYIFLGGRIACDAPVCH